MNLQELASQARELAYAPYSNYKVGAVLIDQQGRAWAGCNVENISFSLTLCAERTALVKMVSAGEHQWTHLELITKDGGTPCGACLQMLSEFATKDADVLCWDGEGRSQLYSFKDLLPHGFQSNEVSRTERASS